MMTQLGFKLFKERFESNPETYYNSEKYKCTTTMHIYVGSAEKNYVGVRRDNYDHMNIWEDGTVEVFEKNGDYTIFNVADVKKVYMYNIRNID